MKKLNKKAAAGIGLGALALVGGTFAYYSQTASLDNPLSTGKYTTAGGGLHTANGGFKAGRQVG